MLEFPRKPDRRTLATFRNHLVLTSLTVTGVFVVIISLSIFVPLAAHLSRAALDDATAAGLADHFLFLHGALWPLVVLSLVSCVASSVLLYQRMRAPLVRFVRCFDSIGGGAVPERLVLRTGDYLTAEAEALNRMIDSLASRASNRESASRRLDAILEDLASREVDPILIEELVAAMKAGLHSGEGSVQNGS